jgi:predicted peptidase
MSKELMISIIIAIACLVGCSKKNDNTELLKKFTPMSYKDDIMKKDLGFRLYIPEGYNTSEKYPLILYLHSGGANGDDNKSQIGPIAGKLISPIFQNISKSFVMIPQCPKGEQWVNTNFKKKPFKNYDQDSIPESHSMKMIVKALADLQKKYSIDNKRLYITGYSMGGSGTWDMITRYPDIFAAAVPVTGVSDPSRAKDISHISVWAFHGVEDEISSVDNTRNMIRELKNNGSLCRYTEYPNIGHDLWSTVYSDAEMVKWLFSQQKKEKEIGRAHV